MSNHPNCLKDDPNNLGFRWRPVKKYNEDYRAKDILWTASSSLRVILTISNQKGAICHLFATERGDLYISEGIEKYAVVPAYLPYINIEKRNNEVMTGTIKGEIMEKLKLVDNNTYAMLLNTPWGCSEAIFGHYFEEFLPFFLEYSKLSLINKYPINVPCWLSWSDFNG